MLFSPPSQGAGSRWELVLILTADPSAVGGRAFFQFPRDVIHGKSETTKFVTPQMEQQMESDCQTPLPSHAAQGRAGKKLGFCRWLSICKVFLK